MVYWAGALAMDSTSPCAGDQMADCTFSSLMMKSGLNHQPANRDSRGSE
jgi:hypothetical protein